MADDAVRVTPGVCERGRYVLGPDQASGELTVERRFYRLLETTCIYRNVLV